ncbi:AzlD domain-containing protein [Rouxiella badensis]|jgi:branched-subunit amino acid transport protein|uniref:Branched-chain amino acid transport n=1 Tax=Rouxiella badensis TaxID=1646377 RepID=A0A1X0WJD8_9GAMM|nr:AzlD domain-containing protein [Rouxiella badensis]MCC3702163.1 AzlD domain-containing protein [Rouxiella badensis]MCC3717169.1 AzlD domain-containing protein [Rouxiella badensis]MCC3728265.1 AzlD domain-containing protein [Rouxiella badensis]MCC3732169.1 AzlD domain-containing protein [Rouxiella badensis]MCC3740009.1 AzlD domain-containing protein [Rouxiella badensis]
MTEHGLIIAGIAVLATGTYLLRLAGFRLGSRLTLSPGANALLGDAATTLLLAVAAVATLYEGGGFAGYARPVGVAVAAFLAWRKKPLIVVILVAAAVSAGLRQIGLK